MRQVSTSVDSLRSFPKCLIFGKDDDSYGQFGFLLLSTRWLARKLRLSPTDRPRESHRGPSQLTRDGHCPSKKQGEELC